MGGSSSKSSVTVKQNTTLINRSSINVFNKMVNTATINVSLQAVQNCSASLINNQKIDISNIVAGEDIVILSSQEQNALMNFSCIQRSDVKNDVVSKLTSQVMTDMKNNVQQDVINKINAQVASHSTSDWMSGFGGGSSSSSKVNQDINTYVENNQKKDIKNVFENALYSNFSNFVESNCIAKIIQGQEFSAKDLTAGRDVKLTVNQKQVAQQLAKCVQENNVSNKVMQDVTNFAGIKIVEDTEQGAETESTSTAEAISKALGPIGSVLDGLGGLIPDFNFPGLGDLGEAGKGLSVSSSSLSCCICLLILLLVLMKFIF